jgi:hypothetical protein
MLSSSKQNPIFLKREDALEIGQTTTLSVENKQLLALIIFVLSVF